MSKVRARQMARDYNPETNQLGSFELLMADPSEADVRRIRAAMMDAIAGIKVLMPFRKKATLPGEQEDEYESPEGDSVWVYTRTPDTALLRELLAQKLGRPAPRPPHTIDPVINILTAIPGYGPSPEEEGKGGAPAAFNMPPDDNTVQGMHLELRDVDLAAYGVTAPLGADEFAGIGELGG